MDALYFSREPIPSDWKNFDNIPRYIQTGVIAFRREALLHFNYLPETPLEIAESVDMNRVIEAGGAVRMLLTESPMLSVDTTEDLAAAEIAITSQPVTATYNFQAY